MDDHEQSKPKNLKSVQIKLIVFIIFPVTLILLITYFYLDIKSQMLQNLNELGIKSDIEYTNYSPQYNMLQFKLQDHNQSKFNIITINWQMNKGITYFVRAKDKKAGWGSVVSRTHVELLEQESEKH